MQGCTIGQLPPGVMPFFAQVLQHVQQHDTPTSSADEADMMKRTVLKSPLAKHDQASQVQPADSSDSDAAAPGGSCGAVNSRPQPAAALPTAAYAPSAAAAAAFAQQQCPAAMLADPLLSLLAPGRVFNAPAAPRSASAAGIDPWLSGLFTVNLFENHGCRCHPGTVRNGTIKRNENNQYCLDCSHVHGAGMCKLCLPGHTASCSGRVFQIRKYMYQTCVHVDDIQPLYDVTGVQAYCINSRRAVLIHPKNVEKEQKCPAFDHSCLGCQKPLRHDCTYCSLRCKVDVEFGFAPITPKSMIAVRDSGAHAAGGVGGASVAAASAAAVMFTVPPSARQQPPGGTSRLPAAAGLKRPLPFARAVAAASALPAHTLDVSHATRCSSGSEGGSSRGKRRKGVPPARSFVN